jgi:opacity protein-like surface antigen
MKKLILSALFVVLGMSAVSASDLYSGGSLKDPATAATGLWSGPYAGITFDGDFVNHTLRVPGVAKLDGLAGEGVGSSVVVGWDFQAGRLVFGPYARAGMSNAATVLELPGAKASITENWDWSAGGRFGVLLVPNALTYAFVGVVQTEFHPGDALHGLRNKVDFGAELGGGIELRPWQNIGLKLEYAYHAYGEGDIAKVGKTSIKDGVDESVIRAGLTYHLSSNGFALPSIFGN